MVLCERLAIARQAYYVELQSIVRSLAQSWWIVYLSLNNRSHIFEVFEESARLYAESSEACDQHNNLTLAVEKAEGSHAKMTDAHKPFRNLLYWKKWRAIVIGRYIQCIKPKQEMWLNIFATILIAAYNLFAYWYRKPVYKFPYERSTPETTQNSM